MRKVDSHSVLSAFWLFILLKIFFRDIHKLARKDVLEIVLEGHYFSLVLTEELALIGGVLALVPIATALVSQVLLRQFVRPLNFAAAIIQTDTMVSPAPTDLDDALHSWFSASQCPRLS